MERELLILGILRGQKMHGYQLAEFIDHNLAIYTELKKATAYFLLDKMCAAGWVASEEAQEGKRPPRRVYEITAAGEAAFQRLLRENLAAYPPAIFAGDVGLGFLDALQPEEALALLAQRRASIAEQYNAVQAAPLHPGGFQWALEHRIAHLRAELHWIDTILNRLRQQTQSTPFI
jgi:DNA-binding PadR family transcriptional regulator